MASEEQGSSKKLSSCRNEVTTQEREREEVVQLHHVDAGDRLLVTMTVGDAPVQAPLMPLLAQVTIKITSLYILWSIHNHCWLAGACSSHSLSGMGWDEGAWRRRKEGEDVAGEERKKPKSLLLLLTCRHVRQASCLPSHAAMTSEVHGVVGGGSARQPRRVRGHRRASGVGSHASPGPSRGRSGPPRPNPFGSRPCPPDLSGHGCGRRESGAATSPA